MPRAIVMIRPFQTIETYQADQTLENMLSKMVLNNSFLKKTGVIFEHYMRAFGWPDFVVSLYGPNEGLIKHAIIQIKKKCKGTVTSTIIGSCPEDKFFRVAAFRSKCLSEKTKDVKKNGGIEDEAIAELLFLEEAKNYLKMHQALLSIFEEELNKSEKAKNYKSGFQTDEKLFKELINKMYTKAASSKEK